MDHGLWKVQNLFAGCFTLDVYVMSLGKVSWEKKLLLQESDKGQISYWSNQTCTRIMLSIDWLIVNHSQKTSKLPYFRLFRPDTQILSALTALYWPSTAIYWPSTTKYQPVPPDTDLVPSWIKHYCLKLIQCHQLGGTKPQSFQWPRWDARGINI